MWVITTQGFYSAVQHRDDPTRVLVRTRNKPDIDALMANYLTECAEKPFAMKFSDYPWRVIIPASDWAKACALMALDVDYPNFKSAVQQRQGSKRSGVYHRIWSALLSIEGPRPKNAKVGKGWKSSGMWGLFPREEPVARKLKSEGKTHAEIARLLGNNATKKMVDKFFREERKQQQLPTGKGK